MRVVHVSFKAGKGGAAGAASRLHKRLVHAGVDSHFYSSETEGISDREHGPRTRLDRIMQSKVIPRIERFITERYRPHPDKHSINLFPSSVVRDVRRLKPDLVHLHWVGNGMIRPESFKKFGCPLVWTCHDLWPLLGAEHYFADSDDYLSGYASSDYRHRGLNINRWLMRRKQRAYKNIRVEVVGNSEWVSECARLSPLFGPDQIRTINFAIDTAVFKPRDRAHCREVFDLEEDAIVVLFGADTLKNKRKGFDLLIKSLEGLPQNIKGKPVVTAVFGPDCEVPLKTNADVRHVGYISDHRLLSLLYNAADVMVTPSRREAFGLTCLESLACGTPVVAYKTGGYLDQVEHMKNGWLAEEESMESLGEGISTILSDENLRAQMRTHALETVMEKFTVEREVGQYLSLYQSLLADTSNGV